MDIEHYILDNNIEIVHGARYSCIYNLNSGKLYSVNSILLNCISLIRNHQGIQVPEEVAELLAHEKIIVPLGTENAPLYLSFKDVKIRFAWIEVTQKCNLFCRHCYEESCAYSTSEMDYNTFCRIIDFLLSRRITRIQLIGGEPCCHADLSKMIDYCHNKFEFIEIFTNGTILNDMLLKQIKALDIHLAFSLYALDERIHDSVTRLPGSLKKTMATLEKVRAASIKYRVASIEMENVPQFKYTYNNTQHKTDFPRLTGRATLELYSRNMLEQKLITKKTFQSLIDPSWFYRNKAAHNCFSEKIYIDACGNVYPCVMERRIKHGNIIQSPNDFTFSEKIYIMNKDFIDCCSDCEFRYSCFDCRPDTNNQNIYAKPWFCTYDPYLGEWTDIDAFIYQLFNGGNNA